MNKKRSEKLNQLYRSENIEETSTPTGHKEEYKKEEDNITRSTKAQKK
jgi:hypothetical protein